MVRRVAVACTMTLTLAAVAASAQTGSSGTSTGQNTATTQAPSSATATDRETRPATTTFFGDTGLWFAPTAEVLAGGKWSASAYRRGTNYIQGYTNVGDFAGTVAVGIKDRAEIFGSFLVDTRIDRDTYPLFFNDPAQGGIIDRYPRVNQHWTGDNVGDLYVGAKVNLWSEYRQNPAALAVRAMVKLPTGKKDIGVSTGKADVSFDFIASKELAKAADVTGYAGYEFRGSPDGFDVPTSAFRWGAGAGFPSRSPVRISAELNGFIPSNDTTTITGAPLIGSDGTVAPFASNTENLTRATAAITFQAPKGFFIGAGLSWNLPRQERLASRTDDDPFADYWDWQVRIGYHPGVRVYVAPPPPPPPPPAPAPEHTLTVKAACDPCSVEIGKSSTLTATATDSISCAVTYRWAAPSGTLASATDRSTLWTASQQEGSVPVTVTVTCPSDNKTASDTVNIQVLKPKPVVELNFEDVYFDFDRSTLRPEALRLLDDAVTKLQANPDKNIIIEGHTCSIGTAEYNLALGERRANSVREYLTSRGVPASRLETRTYGEERPKYDNAREETRRLNRRAALVVKVQ
jgi:outer membrane protein OmpA-like peptidoglycan-associated protein